MGGIVSSPTPAGPMTVATLTLQVSGTPGTYTLGLTESTCFMAGGSNERQLTAAVPFTITVQGQ
jgi:hypothetical protein